MLTTFVAGRFLTYEEVGHFVVLQAVAFLGVTLHQAGIVESGVVLLSRGELSSTRSLSRVHCVSLLGVCVTLLPVYVLLVDLRADLLAAGLAFAGASTAIFARRLLHASELGHLAAALAGVHLGLLGAALLYLRAHDAVSPQAILCAYGATLLALSLPFVWILRGAGAPATSWTGELSLLWRIGRWSLVGSAMYWLYAAAMPLLVSTLSSQSEAGAWALFISLAAPYNQLIAAVSLQALPAFSRRHGRAGRTTPLHVAAVSLALVAPLLVVPEQILDLVYGKVPEYARIAMALIAFTVVMEAVKQYWVLRLMARKCTAQVTIARIASLAGAWCAAALSIPAWGAVGGALSLTVGNVVMAAATGWFDRRTGDES